MRHSSVSSSHGGRWANVREFSDEPESDGDDGDRDSFDVDSERESQVGDVDAEREAHAIQVIQERMSQILTESFERQPPHRRRMTDPPPQYSRLRREEIHVEPLTATRLSFPTTARFERGVKLSRRATYTPSFTTTQFHSSMSIHGAADVRRRASLTGRVEYQQRDKRDFDRPKEEPETEPAMDPQRWTFSAPPSSISSRYQRSPAEKSNDAEMDAPSAATKSSRRRRFSAAVKGWFK